MLLTKHQLADLARQLEAEPHLLRSAATEVDCDPLDMVRAGAGMFARSSYFASPGGSRMASLGAAVHLASSGSERFSSLDEQLADLPQLVPGARVVLGFSFSPDGPTQPEWKGFAAADAVLPTVTAVAEAGVTRLFVAVPAGTDHSVTLGTLAGLQRPTEPPPPDPGAHTVESVPAGSQWQAAVADTVAAIRDGSLRKAVLARSVVVRSEWPTDPYELVHHLSLANPSCYIYATAVGESVFVGASPELLLSQQGSEILVNPLAGSARRGRGDDDLAVGQELLASNKDRTEHAIVVDDLVARLGELTTRLDYSSEPSLRRMATVQHLSTEIKGELRSGLSAFDVLKSIHPTPAVGGTPRPEALAFIDKVEGIDRGWYAGGVGWLDPAGSAQVALALRCALINGTTSRLYAGNGIVADSDPAAELIETRLKFQPMLSQLAAT